MEDAWIVTEIEPYQKSKYKVYLNDEFTFLLYKSELNRMKIKEGDTLSKEMYSFILTEILNKRAVKRAMHLLKFMDRTECQLREKLRENFYPEESVEAAIAYVKSYHYVNDEEYALRYTDSRSRTKSRRQIEMELTRKGISPDKIDRAVQESEFDDRKVIREILLKKGRNIDLKEPKQRQKVIRHLLYKGFEWEDVRYEMEHLT